MGGDPDYRGPDQVTTTGRPSVTVGDGFRFGLGLALAQVLLGVVVFAAIVALGIDFRR